MESVIVENRSGLKLHAKVAGDRSSKDLLLFVHGFPEFWGSWKEQLDHFSSDYLCVAPDLRGYNLSAKPKDRPAYEVDALIVDLIDWIEHFGRQRAIVIGHDWGAVLAWRLALQYPEKVQAIAALSIPHPAILQQAYMASTALKLVCAHFVLFQAPLMPELSLSALSYEGLKSLMMLWSENNAAIEAAWPQYREAMSQPDALHCALEYYRANLRGGMKRPRHLGLRAPGITIYGEKDKMWIADMFQAAERFEALFPAGHRYQAIPGAGHFLQIEAPAAVNEALAGFLQTLPK